MSPNLILIRAKLEGATQVQAGLEGIGEAGQTMGKSIKSGADKAGAALDVVQAKAKKLKTVGKSLTHSVTLPILGIGAASVDMGLKFQRSVLLLHTQAGVAKKELSGLEKGFLRIARLTNASPEEVSGAAFRLAGAGLRGKQLENATLKAAQLAMVGDASPEDTAKTLSQIWFTNIKGGKDFNHVIGELNATVGAGDLRLPQLVDALGTGVVASAKQAGLRLQDVTSAMAVFGDETNNVSGWSAQFATALHYLTAPGDKAAGALESIGLSGSKLSEDLHKPNGLITSLKDLKSHLAALPGGEEGVQANKIISEILPGGRGRVLLVLMNQLERLEIKMKQIKGTTDEFHKSLKQTEENPLVRLEMAWSGIQASLVEIGSQLIPIVVPALEKVATIVSDIGTAFSHLPDADKNKIVDVLLALAALGPVLWVVGGVVGSVVAVLGVLVDVVGALGIALAFVAANPIVLAVLALAAAFAYLYFKVEWFHNAVNAVVSFVVAHWKLLLPLFLAPFLPLTAAIVLVVTHLKWFENAFNNVVAFFKALPGRIVAGIKQLPHLIGSIVAKMIVFWATLPVRIMLLQAKFVGLVVHTTLTLGPKLLSAGVTIVGKLLHGLITGWTDVMNWFHTLPGKFASWIASMANKFFEIGKTIAKEMWKGFKESLPGPLKEGLNIGGEVVESVGGTLGEVGSALNPFSNAKGTEHFAGGWSWVGEEGPELLRLPRASKIRPVTRASGGIHIPPQADVSREDGTDPFWSRDIVIPVTVKMDSEKVAKGVAKASESKKARD